MFVEYKKDVRIKLNKVQMMISDFLFHQMPFLLTINAVNEEKYMWCRSSNTIYGMVKL